MTEQERNQRFRTMALPHLDAAYNLARWLVRDDHHAQDAVQEACMRAIRSLDGLRGETARPWLLAIVRNVCFDQLRAQRASDDFVAYDEDAHGAVAASSSLAANPIGDDPARLLARADDRRLVNEALARLPTPFREVIVLRDIEELSYKEIAQIAAIPLGTVMSRLARGRKLLLEMLSGTLQECGNGL